MVAKIRAEFLNHKAPVTIPAYLETFQKLEHDFSDALEKMVNEALTCAKDWPVDVWFPVIFEASDGIGRPPVTDPLTIYIELPICEDGANEWSEDRPAWSISLSAVVREMIGDAGGDDPLFEPERLVKLRDGFFALVQEIDEAVKRARAQG